MQQDATVVFDGVIYKIYQWQQKLFDGSTRVYERAITLPSVMIIPVTQDGKIVLIHEQKIDSKHTISLPKGFANQNEEVQDSAIRELREETGYSAKEIKLYKKTGIVSGYFKWELYFFIAKSCKLVGEPIQRPGEKILDVELVSFENFLNLVVNDKLHVPFIEADLVRAYYDENHRKKLEKLMFE